MQGKSGTSTSKGRMRHIGAAFSSRGQLKVAPPCAEDVFEAGLRRMLTLTEQNFASIEFHELEGEWLHMNLNVECLMHKLSRHASPHTPFARICTKGKEQLSAILAALGGPGKVRVHVVARGFTEKSPLDMFVKLKVVEIGRVIGEFVAPSQFFHGCSEMVHFAYHNHWPH